MEPALLIQFVCNTGIIAGKKLQVIVTGFATGIAAIYDAKVRRRHLPLTLK
jgi:hypothetical protein